MQLLEELEPVRVLQLQVNSKDNDLQQSMKYTPRLGLEDSRDEVSWGGWKETTMIS